MFSLNDLLRWRAELHPNATALVDDRGGRATYRELHEQSEACARRWSRRGVKPGEVVAVLDTNSVPNLIHLFGLSRLGAIPAMLNWRLSAAENEALFELVKPAGVAADASLVGQLPSQLPDVLVTIHGTPPVGWVADDAHEHDDLIQQADDLGSLPDPSGVFALAFSSGTTGRPKGIPLRHESLARSVMVDSADIEGMSLGDRHILAAPTFHLAGLVNGLMGLAGGAEIHLRTSFDPAATLNEMSELGVAYMTAVPAMFRALVQAAASRPEPPDTSTVKEMTYGASPIPSELIREIQHLFPGTRLRQFYGMTEVAGALTTLTPQDHNPDEPYHRSAGRVNPGYEVRLIDRDGVEVPDGEPGQIMIRGHAVFHGYWEDPDATADAFTDGWFASGDIAIRNDGYLTIMDRAKDMIVSGGENVYPAEVEAALYEHVDVVDAAVIGIPSDTYGEQVHAVVVVKPGIELELEQLRVFCRERLAGYKLPRSLELLAELPRNATGKVLKRDLRAPHWEGHDRRL